MTEKEILQEILTKVTNVEAEQQFMKSDLQSIKMEKKAMKTDIQSIKTEQKSMKEEQQAMKDMLASQGEHIHQLIQIVGTTNAHLEELTDSVMHIKKDISAMKDIQQGQYKILERLSIRSISQEADIAELRRIK